ncbi:MAG: hypothetical protein DKM50_09215 [Candidatus Margulisiibacteriota bacterium]|nr:MAG: hypothetical protein A2X43_02105 [Candidatus Margulisbacteria bacterium GWD2_39_127]PZM79434.1 MAG: hypothetical protein DKM50_09215 [Candidatus Margulisiibacteriota bacterium]HAR63513.1 hypothetical protein [Candidatus Margulisiibacteriota bacterium]HCY38080.1 hypothetical protein [Candidatus Margulisiibacteriota bacterium]
MKYLFPAYIINDMELKHLVKLFGIINKENGIFLEAGANDGIFDSYTYYLEKDKHWKGVLVEPSINAFHACVKNRPHSYCINAALTNDEQADSLSGDFDGHPMSSIEGKRLNRMSNVSVKALTLNKVFANHLKDIPVDLMSIDVENYELPVLMGLDYSQYRPRFILVEIYTPTFLDTVNFLLRNDYALITNITGFNPIDNPAWDGTHNDYLFGSLR